MDSISRSLLIETEPNLDLWHPMPVWSPGVVETVESTFVGPTRNGMPTLVGYFGFDERSRTVGVILFDWPDQLPHGGSKYRRERVLLDRLDADMAAAVGTRFFDSYRRGPDPPDFTVESEGAKRGVDVTQLVLEDRAVAHATFRDLRGALIQRGPQRFRPLGGSVVYVTFNGSRDGGLPPRKKTQLRPTLDAIEGLRPGRPVRDRPTEVPEETSAAVDGAHMSICPLPLAYRPTWFFNIMGFEVACGFTSVVYQDDAWDEMQRLVTQHDTPGVSELVVAVGAPVIHGVVFPSDTVTGALVLNRAQSSALEAKHIERILLHYWLGRALFKFEPGKTGHEELFSEDLSSSHVPEMAILNDWPVTKA